MQIDPVAAVERNQHLVLAARKVFEYWANAACVIPIDDYPIFEGIRRRHRRRAAEELARLRPVIDAVLARVASDGPMPARAFAAEDRVHGWWDSVGRPEDFPPPRLGRGLPHHREPGCGERGNPAAAGDERGPIQGEGARQQAELNRRGAEGDRVEGNEREHDPDAETADEGDGGEDQDAGVEGRETGSHPAD